MKLKKIVIIIIFILFIMNFSIEIYAESIPSANANSNEISTWIKKNSSKLSNVSIDTLVAWYKTCSSNTATVAKIDSALKNKNAGEIESWTRGKSIKQIKSILSSTSPTSIINSWLNVSGLSSETKELLSDTSTNIKEEKEEQKLKSTTINPSDFDPSKSREEMDDAAATKLGNKIIGAIQGLGSVVSVITLIIIGIKYMMGSAEEKADYKKTMIPYLIGAFLVFASSNVVSAIYNAIY